MTPKADLADAASLGDTFAVLLRHRGRGTMPDKMIRPLLMTWPSVERGQEGKSWDDVADARQPIEAWERRTGLQLPSDYKSFMLKFNGGRVYPNMFNYAVPLERYPSTEPETFLDPLYDWEYVEKIWSGEEFGEGCPPGMLDIGSNPGGLEVLLSVSGDTYGQIFNWLRSTNKWGTDGNDEVWLQAPSFRAFMDNLFDNSDRLGYDHWHLPGLAPLVRELSY
ncbi:SMI1/KNR4 family protein [Devosia sp. ZW T5_3]|uniref:SMI1/KNR4 family protein n=1 Tax=Devosia sp. ZW T5_3 TaxID=3378085 RepID=UPI003854715F